MFKIQCVTKNQRMEGQDIVTDVMFNPYNEDQQNGQNMYASGAAIGTPNAPNPATGQANPVQNPEPPKFTLTSGFGFTIRDAKEADKYEVGKVYTFNMQANEIKEEPQAQKQSKQPAQNEQQAQ